MGILCNGLVRPREYGINTVSKQKGGGYHIVWWWQAYIILRSGAFGIEAQHANEEEK